MSACERALNHAKKLEIDECESIQSKRKITTVRITDSEIAEIKQIEDESIGIRLIYQKRISSIQTSNLNNIEKSIDDAFKISSYLEPKKFWKNLPHQVRYDTTLERLYDSKLANISGEQASDIAQEMINSASTSGTNLISGSLNVVSEDIEISNSNGLQINDKATYVSGIINADSEKGSSPVSGMGHASCRTMNCFSPETIGKDAATMCVESINPQKCDEGSYSIIFEPYSVGEMLAFVFSSNFNIKTFSEKKSCFSEKFEKKIAVDEFSLMDDPHAQEGIGSKAFDDEGVPTKPQSLIENGIFRNIFSDSFSAFKEDTKSTGNACRPGSPMGRNSEPIPVSAPHNLRIKKGEYDQDEIIKETKHGLLVGRLWYTYAVNPIKGDFSCTARSGIRIIENGQIRGPGKSVRIIHNLPILLEKISAIGNNERNVLQWASLPSITPTVKVEDIKVISI